MTCIRAKCICVIGLALFRFSVTLRSCVFPSDLFKAPPLRPSSRNAALPNIAGFDDIMHEQVVCLRARVYTLAQRISRVIRRRPWRALKRGVDTWLRLSIAPQSLVCTSCYLFTGRRDIFRIDIRIYVTWESHKILFSSLECR